MSVFRQKKGNTPTITVVTVFLLLVLFSLNPINTFEQHTNRKKTLSGNPPEAKDFFYKKLPRSIKQYTTSEPISITSDAEFYTTAKKNGWPGDGSATNPYIIDGIHVYGPGSNLIDIQTTNVHFQISNCLLSGGKHGIHIRQASNGRIVRNIINENEEDGIVISGEPRTYTNGNFTVSANTVSSNGDSGIFLTDIDKSLVFNNTVNWNSDDGISINICNTTTVIDNTLEHNVLSKVEASPPFSGISVIWSTNCAILDNYVFKNYKSAIQASTSNNITIRNNVIQNCDGEGIEIHKSRNTTVINNNITNNIENVGRTGILISLSENNLISGNIISSTVAEGILVEDGSNSNEIFSNFISNTDSEGILLKQSNKNTVQKNFVQKSELDGVQLELSDSNVISENEFINNSEQGITILKSRNNLIYKNKIKDNDGQGVSIDGGNNNTISWNDFENNGRIHQQKISQGHDDCQGDISNNFTYNYWDDHNNDDSNLDCIADIEYTLGGSGNANSDNHPLIRPFRCYSTPPPTPTIQYPNGGEVLKGSVDIVWQASNDSFYPDKVNYSLLYSDDGGINWEPIEDALNLSSTTYRWPTLRRDDGENYMLMIKAANILGLTNNDTSDKIFAIENHFFVPEPKITFPKGGETLSGKVVIEWEKAVDIYGHEITYSVSYSADSGVSWVLLASDLPDTSYSWATTSVSDGSNYMIKINATCSEGKSKIDMSGEFIISNGPPSPIPLLLLVGILGAIGTAFVLGTRRGRTSIRGLFSAAGLREKEIEAYAKKAKKVADDIEED